MKPTLVTLTFLLLSAHFAAANTLNGKAWQITDIHLDVNYKPDTDYKAECHSGTGDAGEFGDYRCDTSMTMMDSSIANMPKFVGDVDYVFWTGDAYPHVNESSKEMLIQSLQDVTDGIMKLYPDTPVFPVLGNHDVIPCHQMLPGPNWLYDEVAKMWDKWLDDEMVKTFRQGGFYQKKLVPGLRVICINTVLYYINNHATLKLKDPAGQFAWLNDTLHDARDNGDSVWIIGHVAPGVTERSGGMQTHDQFNGPLVAIFEPFHRDGTIINHLYGHLHTDTFRVMPGGGAALLAPAVDMWYVYTHLHTYLHRFNYWSGEGSNNPAIRMLEFDTSSFNFTQYTQYYTDLGADNDKGAISWMEEYRSSDPPYSLRDLSGASMQEFIDNCINKDGPCFDAYLQRNPVMVPTKCDDHCKKLQRCAVAHVIHQDFKDCVGY